MPRTYPPSIEPRHRAERGAIAREYLATNGTAGPLSSQFCDVEARRDGHDGHLILSVYGGDPGTEVRIGPRAEYRFLFQEAPSRMRHDRPALLTSQPDDAPPRGSVPASDLRRLTRELDRRALADAHDNPRVASAYARAVDAIESLIELHRAEAAADA
jgi:hypothetical protein